jgi:hypothetical protein
LNLTERSEFDDEDKILYQKIGKSEIAIDKVLSNLLVVEEYVTLRNIIMQENEDDIYSESDEIFSSGSVKNPISADLKNLIQTKGKISLMFRAELTEEFLGRVEKVKRQYIKDT